MRPAPPLKWGLLGAAALIGRVARLPAKAGTEQKLQDNEVVTYRVVDVVGDGSMA